MLKAKLFFKELQLLFPSWSNVALHANIVRLAVLYEDLRIELYAVAEDSLPKLDTVDNRYRRNYFLRRSVGTLWEFAEALIMLDSCPDFQAVKEDFTSKALKDWKKSLSFFKRYEPFLKSIRNDCNCLPHPTASVGGHWRGGTTDPVGELWLRRDRWAAIRSG
ncbi:MAG: hypothetical protein L0312_07525 [Acidobacteria bacterium]|nr:hypothetical protein [Acidobacteriota bacterium]